MLFSPAGLSQPIIAVPLGRGAYEATARSRRGLTESPRDPQPAGGKASGGLVSAGFMLVVGMSMFQNCPARRTDPCLASCLDNDAPRDACLIV